MSTGLMPAEHEIASTTAFDAPFLPIEPCEIEAQSPQIPGHNISRERVFKAAAVLAVAGSLLASARAEGKVPHCERDSDTYFKATDPYSDAGKEYKGSGNCRVIKFAPDGKKSKGLLLLFAASGWSSSPQLVEQAYGSIAGAATKAGWDTRVVEITSRVVDGKNGYGRKGVADARQWYDHSQRPYKRNKRPVVVGGTSAGGHVALMVASQRPAIDGFVTAGSPTELETNLPGVRGAAIDAFGAQNLVRYSPIRKRFRMPGFMAHMPGDMVVPSDQTVNFTRKFSSLKKSNLRSFYPETVPYAEPDCDGTASNFIHSCASLSSNDQPPGVTREGSSKFHQKIERFLKSIHNKTKPSPKRYLKRK